MTRQTYILWVPITDRHSIWPGSALVGEEIGDRVHLHYEGSSSMTFDERILHAAGRRYERYPTVAQTSLARGDVAPVAIVIKDPVIGWVLEEITDADALAKWAPDHPPLGGSAKQREDAVGRHWMRIDPAKRAVIQARARLGENLVDLTIEALNGLPERE